MNHFKSRIYLRHFLCSKMLISLIFYGMCVIAVESQIRDLFRSKTIRIHQFRGQCPEYNNLTLYLTDIKLSLVQRIHYVSFKSVTTRTMDHDMKLELNLKRCPSQESLDSCEDYQTIHINRMCKLLVGEHKPWTSVVKGAKPPMQCPLVKGVRIVKDATFDGNSLSAFPVNGWFWKITAKLLDVETDEILMCVYVEAQLVPI